MPGKISDIRFPLGGQSKRLGFQAQEPFTFLAGENVRPEDVFEYRLRGGSRPGLSKHSPTLLGTGSPVRLLNSLRSSADSGITTYEDEFTGTSLSGVWTQASWSDVDGKPTVGDGYAIGPSGSDNLLAVVRDTLTASANADQTIIAQPYNHTAIGSSIQIYMLMNNSSPDVIVSGLQVTFSHDGSGNKAFIYIDGVLKSTTDYFAAPNDSKLRVDVTSNNLVKVYWGEPFVTPDATYQIPNYTRADTYTKIGFGLGQPASAPIGNPRLDWFRFEYRTTASGIAPVAVVASSNGLIYTESKDGTMEDIEASDPQAMNLASDRLLSSAERFGKLYIADYEVRAEASDGLTEDVAADTDFKVFDDVAGKDWVALGVDSDGDRLEILTASGGDGTELGVHDIASITTTKITLSAEPFNGALSAVKYRIVRAPKVFDYRNSTNIRLSMLTKKSGTTVNPPLGCTIAAIWQDRLVLSGDPENPGDTFFSKQGDPTNWQEDETATSPVFGEFDTNTRIDEPVKALIPFVRDYLVIGAADSIHVLRGNPVAGGTVDAVSRAIGILDKHAWCMTPDNILVVMTGDGLYGIGPGATSAESISRESLPQDLANIDTDNNDVQLAFDVRRAGIVVAITPTTVGENMYYWFDWTTKTIWKDVITSTQEPTAMTAYQGANDSTSIVIFGGRDGYLRTFDTSAIDDDGTAFTSYVLIGPLVLGGSGYHSGLLREVIGQLSTLSGTVTCEVQVGDSIESAYRATPRSAFTLRAGKSLSWFPRLKGNACFLKLSSTNRWALEQLSVVREQLGKQRLFG